MAARNVRKIQSQIEVSIRNYSSKKESSSSSFWGLFSKKKGKEEEAAERCRRNRKIVREDPDLSKFGGQPYRTCGSAYVVQKDIIPSCAADLSDEHQILKNIEADLDKKNTFSDPMPPFQSVEQRLIDLTDRKLHPFYKRYIVLSKKIVEEDSKMAMTPYKCKSGPVSPDEIPDVFNFNKELLEKKNIFADFKRVELPKQMVVRMVEIHKNRKPTMEKKVENVQKKGKK